MWRPWSFLTFRRTNTVLTYVRRVAHSKDVRFSLVNAALLLGLMASSSFASQFLSVGVKAGVPFTDAFSGDTYGTSPNIFRSTSGDTSYLVGPTGEIHLILGLSVEADALYRPLHLNVENASGNPVADHSYASWEFPILAKWRFPFPVLKPYIEGGPSFRAIGGTASNYLSNDGITFGVGLELHVSRVRIGPELRFTHWGSDGVGAAANGFSSNQNQGEFLVGFSF
jgi:hypothetical protein